MHFMFLSLFVKDLNASLNFYENMAGLKVLRKFENDGFKIAFLADSEGDTEIELLQPPAGIPLYEGKGLVICFETDDIESAKKKAIGLGLNPSDIHSHGNGSRFFHVLDPDGCDIEFMQPPKR